MSTTVTAFDLKAFLTGMIQRSANRLADDLAHLSTEQLSTSPMGVARNPLHFSAECIGFNSLVVNAFSGAPSLRPSEEAREKFFASFDSLEKAQAGLRRSAEEVVAVIAEADEAKLTEQAMAPWGEPMPLYMLIYVAADHMSYHDGQVNYIQTLYGDAEVHWG